MHTILVVAMSQDGFIADSSGSYTWVSQEDGKFFHQLLAKHRLRIMGRTTYQNEGSPVGGNALRVVMTKTPENFTDVPGQLAHRTGSMSDIHDEFSSQYNSCLILGGSRIYQQALIDEQIVDEMYITFEPIELHNGTPFLSSGKDYRVVLDLPKPSVTDLNNSGTKLLHYMLK